MRQVPIALAVQRFLSRPFLRLRTYSHEFPHWYRLNVQRPDGARAAVTIFVRPASGLASADRGRPDSLSLNNSNVQLILGPSTEDVCN